MKTKKLSSRIVGSFDIIIVTFSLLVVVLGYYVIKKDIIKRAQTKVNNDLNSAREIYAQELENVKDIIRFTASRFFINNAISTQDNETLDKELEKIRTSESLDILTLTDASGKVLSRSRNPSVTGDIQTSDTLISRVLSSNKVFAGTVIVPMQELIKEGEDLAEQANINFISTPKARLRAETRETSGMMIKAAAPVFGYDGKLSGVLYGGNLLNRNYKIVDKVKEIVYKGETYKGKDIGTVTIFQDDLRISTNVKAKGNIRAVGTRVSEEVYEQVLVKGLPWIARAFVVNDWYKTAYEPIKDIDDRIVGMLYVGILERPFTNMAKNTLLLFLMIVCLATALAVSLGIVLTRTITRPVERMLKATRTLSAGSLGYEVDKETGTVEFDELADSFNKMSAQLREREESLKNTNEKLAILNKTYLDLVGFVSHELKGIVATTLLNAAAVRDGLFGQINEKQKNSLESVTKSLHYFKDTVRKFLDLSRIEKGELEVNKKLVRLREDVFDPCLETFSAEITSKQMEVTNNIAAEVKVNGDLDLLHIVANNLLGNAVKYGLEKGKIIISSENLAEKVQIEVYNDSRPIKEEEKDKLFKKFSRLEVSQGKKIKGTGLGLFLTKEIITQHGGDIWVRPEENGNTFIFQIEKFPDNA
ncbi:MAG: cache domain-containing protein [Sedimentisphaerales bacterium]|nr:cache domain-containing protein [Sedimentisphaerales bacterium]